LTDRIDILPSAQRELAALPVKDRKQVDKRIRGLGRAPRPPGGKALQGQKGLFRLRVRRYRVIYQIRDDVLVVIVVKVGHRRDVYRSL